MTELSVSKLLKPTKAHYCTQNRPQRKLMFSQVSVCPQSASWLFGNLRRGRYASYWNAFLFHGRVSVILFTGGGGGSLYDVTSCLADWSHVHSGESLCLVLCYFWGVSLTETPLDRDPPDRDSLDRDPPHTLKSGRYASYWNAFLFLFFFFFIQRQPSGLIKHTHKMVRYILNFNLKLPGNWKLKIGHVT